MRTKFKPLGLAAGDGRTPNGGGRSLEWGWMVALALLMVAAGGSARSESFTG